VTRKRARLRPGVIHSLVRSEAELLGFRYQFDYNDVNNLLVKPSTNKNLVIGVSLTSYYLNTSYISNQFRKWKVKVQVKCERKMINTI
jgi:hypothetical protein